MSDISFKEFVDTQNIIDGRETPDLHIKICDWLQDTQADPRRILQVFRYAGKSHLICLYIVWRLLVDPNFTTILISAKRNIALRNSLMIRTIIETNPLTKHLKSDLYQWQSQNFTVDRDIISLHPSVAVSSLASVITGRHSDILIGDDLETSDNSLTKQSRERIKERVQEFGKIAKQILLIGTPHTNDSLYEHLVDLGYSIEKIPVYNSETQELAWPNHPEGLFTWDWLEKSRNESSEGDFKAQYQLIPSKTYNPLISLDKINDYNEEVTTTDLPQPYGGYMPIVRLGKKNDSPNIKRMCAAWDPATGLHARDRSVLGVTMRDDRGNVYVHDVIVLTAVDKTTKDFSHQIKTIVNACTEYGIATVFIEENYSASLINEAKRVCREMNKKIKFVNKFRSKNKKVFIAQTLEPVIKIGRMYVHKRVKEHSFFISELEEFPHNAHDDCIDAVAESISHLPEPSVDISRIPGVQNIVSNVAQKVKISRPR